MDYNLLLLLAIFLARAFWQLFRHWHRRCWQGLRMVRWTNRCKELATVAGRVGIWPRLIRWGHSPAGTLILPAIVLLVATMVLASLLGLPFAGISVLSLSAVSYLGALASAHATLRTRVRPRNRVAR